MLIKTPASNMEAYSILRSSFKWENEQRNLEGLPDNAGLNMAHESVDRHANGNLCDRLALRWIRNLRTWRIVLKSRPGLRPPWGKTFIG